MDEEFIGQIAEILEVEADEISLTTAFRTEVEGWDSMRGFSILCMIEDEFNVRMEVPEFLECETVGDLVAAVQARA